MMKRVLAGLVILVLAVQADAIMLNRGVRTLSVNGYLNYTTDLNLELAAKGGRFIKDFVQIGAIGSLAWIEGGDLLLLGGGAFGEISVPMYDHQLWVPYYGGTCSLLYADLDTVWGESKDIVLQVSGYGGIKYFLLDNLAIGSDLEVKLATSDIYLGNKKMRNFDWIINLSTRFYF